MKYCFLDVETSGFAKLRNGVITLAAYVTDQSYTLLDEFYMEVRPDGARRVVWNEESAKVVHGISWETAIQFPPMEESVPRFKEFCQKHGPMIFIAHNMPFDRRMTKELFEKTNHISSEFFNLFPEQQCTLKLVKGCGLIEGKVTKLSEVCAQLGIELIHHNAKSDAFVLIEIHKRATTNKTIQDNTVLTTDSTPTESHYEGALI